MGLWIIRVILYVMCFILAFRAMNAWDFEKILKPGHTRQAQVLYWLIAAALGYLAAQFVLGLIYMK